LRTYETVFILDGKKLDDAGEAFCRDVSKRIRKLGGRVRKRTPLGRKQFARPIGKIKAGTYWDLVIDLDPAEVGAFQEQYKLDAVVLRLTMFQTDEGSREKKPVLES